MANVRSEQKRVKEVAATAAVAASEAAWPQTRAILRIIFIALAVIAVLFILYALTGVLLLVVLSIFFAYLIAPLVEMVRRPFNARGRKRKLPRAAAIGVVYFLLFGTLFTTIYLLMPRIGAQMAEFTRNAPDYLTNARTRAQRLDDFYDRLRLPPSIRRTANDAVNGALTSARTYLIGDEGGEGGEGVKSALVVLGYLPWLILVPILAFFLLKDADSFRRSALQLLPQGRLRWRGDEFFQDVNSTLAAYIRAQLIACLLIGTVCTVGFYLIGVRYALVLGLIAGMLEFIPLVGPLVVALIAVSVASFYSLNQVIAVLFFLGVLRIIHDYVTYPRIIGSGIHLHPLAVILAILSGHELAGIAGIFLAIPAIAVLTVTYRHWLEHRGSSGLVADLLKPAEQAITAPPSGGDSAPAPVPVQQQPTPSDA
ncbi:MAG TPA: AI-2E family transporter [Pyrinomonadaceae bacterium]|nr:AI-2E family transporter [Pyrinomonadaceae bacterium]